MIKYHFKNDVNKIRELLTMTKTIPEEKYEELSLNESLILKIQDRDETIAILQKEIEKKDKKIKDLDKEIKNLDKEIKNGKNKIIKLNNLKNSMNK